MTQKVSLPKHYSDISKFKCLQSKQVEECSRMNASEQMCVPISSVKQRMWHNSTLPLDFASWVGELIQPCAFLYKVLMKSTMVVHQQGKKTASVKMYYLKCGTVLEYSTIARNKGQSSITGWKCCMTDLNFLQKISL